MVQPGLTFASALASVLSGLSGDQPWFASLPFTGSTNKFRFFKIIAGAVVGAAAMGDTCASAVSATSASNVNRMMNSPIRRVIAYMMICFSLLLVDGWLCPAGRVSERRWACRSVKKVTIVLVICFMA